MLTSQLADLWAPRLMLLVTDNLPTIMDSRFASESVWTLFSTSLQDEDQTNTVQALKLFIRCKICKCAKLKSILVSLCFPGSSWMCQLPGVELDWKVSYTIPASFIVSFPDRIFRARRKNRSGELPIPFSFKCAGMLAHCSFLI